MINTPTEKAAAIMRHYGAEEQLTLLCEECAELIQAACKCRQRGVTMSDDMIEEIADVTIMLVQFEMTMKRSVRHENRRFEETPRESREN